MAIKKNNFSYAIKKLWNDNDEGESESFSKYIIPEENISANAADVTDVKDISEIDAVEAASEPYYKPTVQKSYEKPENENMQITSISSSTYIDGSIRSTTDINISGNVNGNVETTKNIRISGTIIGDVKCSDLTMIDASLQGNVKTKGHMSVNRDSIIIGDVDANELVLNGKLKGNLCTSGKVELQEDAVIFGNINAASIYIAEGAVVQGHIDTTYLSDNENDTVFPEQIVIS